MSLRTAKLSEEGKKIVEAINSKIEELQQEFRDASLQKNQQIEELQNDFKNAMVQKDQQITQLRNETNILKNKLEKTESRLSDSDTVIRQRNIILSGNELPKEESGENCTEVVRKLIQTKLRTIVPSTDIDAAFRIGKPSATGQQARTRSILVKFNKPESKKSLIASCKTYKPDFYINEDLSPEKQTIMYVLREAKRKFPNIVSGSSCVDGRIAAWIKPQHPDEGSSNRRVNVNSLEKLKTFCRDTIDSNLETFIARWPH